MLPRLAMFGHLMKIVVYSKQLMEEIHGKKFFLLMKEPVALILQLIHQTQTFFMLVCGIFRELLTLSDLVDPEVDCIEQQMQVKTGKELTLKKI